jgi:hypothetical protein
MKKTGIVILEKGSQEAKDYMARLRSLRKPKGEKKEESATSQLNADAPKKAPRTRSKTPVKEG